MEELGSVQVAVEVVTEATKDATENGDDLMKTMDKMCYYDIKML